MTDEAKLLPESTRRGYSVAMLWFDYAGPLRQGNPRVHRASGGCE
jgi:hypothetical protein